MNDLAHALVRLARHKREVAYSTQGERIATLLLIANQLVAMGYPHRGPQRLTPEGMKLRHANRLVEAWKAEGLSTGTIYNRLAVLRWIDRTVHPQPTLPPKNARWGLEPRQTVPTESKAVHLSDAHYALIPDPYLRLSLALQAAYGLRREECLKFQPHWADCGSYVRLKGSWCKNGRYREVPITLPEQRVILDAAKVLVPGATASLIPQELTYIQQRRRYDALTRRVGLRNLHGLRHAHFQARFETLTGFKCPVEGGPRKAEMTEEQRALDVAARHVLPAEMGHGRSSVCSTYFGR